MTRNPIQDIVPGSGHRSIRNVPLPKHHPKSNPRPAELETEITNFIEEEKKEAIRDARHEFEHAPKNSHSSSKGDKKKLFIASGVVAFVLVVIFVLSTLFHSATVTVTPRTQKVSLKNDITAVKSTTVAGLSFQSKIIKQTGSVQLKANGEKQVSTQASGTIVIYNNYSAASQRLVKNTRFQTPEGLIYRISDSVTVPGKKGTIPGTVEAVIVADEAGDKYNVGLKDFTIPGFKGDPRFSAFYAKSKPSKPLAGGFAGTVKIVADADLLKAQADIKTKATVELLKQANAQVPANSVFFNNADTVLCSALPQENVSSSEVLVKMECVLSAAFFDKFALSSQLAKINGITSNDPVFIQNIENLTFTPKDGFDPTADSVSFNIQGDATFEWVYDETIYKQKLAGINKSQVASTTQAFPTIEKVSVSVSPFWLNTFPSNVKDITIKKAI